MEPRTHFSHIIGGEPKLLTKDAVPAMWNTLLSRNGLLSTISVNVSAESALCLLVNMAKAKEGKAEDGVSKICVMLQHIYLELFELTEKQKESFCITKFQESEVNFILVVAELELSLTKKRKVLSELHNHMDTIHIPAISNNARYASLIDSYTPTKDIQVYTYLDANLAKCVVKPLFPTNGTSHLDHLSFYCKLDPFLASEVKLKRNNTAYMKTKIKMDNINDVSNVGYESEMEMVTSLVKMLAGHRCGEAHDFIKVGQCIFDACYGRDEGFELWKLAAAKSDHPATCNPKCLSKCEGKCLTKWRNIWDDFNISDDRSINLLRMWACMDSKEEYLKWKNGNVLELIRESVKVTGGNADIANVFYNLNQDKYVCSNYSKGEWYEFTTRWRFVDGAYSVKKAITEELVPKYVEALNQFNRNMAQAQDDKDKERWSRYVDRCTKIIVKLKDDGFKSSILKSCAEKFYDENFERQRDKIPHLLGFDDGLFDCLSGKFRPADPRERVTITCGYPMPQNYSWEHEHVVRVMEILSMIITNSAKLEFYLATMGDLLKSGNRLKRMLVSIGPSNSGKSVLENISEHSLGEEYWVKPPVEQLTWQGDTNPDGATASREILKYAKEANYSEPRAGAKLNDSMMKTMVSGGDGLFSRNLHQGVTRNQNMKIRPGYLPVYNTNHRPKYDGTDASLYNKLIFFVNNSQFIDVVNNFNGLTVPATVEEQRASKTFPMNIYLKDEIKDKKLYQAYMWIRCQYNTKYLDKYIEIPYEIKEDSKLNNMKNDPILDFLKIKVLKGTAEDAIDAESLYACFVAYHKSRCPNDPKNGPSSADLFEDKMMQKGYELNKDNKWIGIKWNK